MPLPFVWSCLQPREIFAALPSSELTTNSAPCRRRPISVPSERVGVERTLPFACMRARVRQFAEQLLRCLILRRDPGSVPFEKP